MWSVYPLSMQYEKMQYISNSLGIDNWRNNFTHRVNDGHHVSLKISLKLTRPCSNKTCFSVFPNGNSPPLRSSCSLISQIVRLYLSSRSFPNPSQMKYFSQSVSIPHFHCRHKYVVCLCRCPLLMKSRLTASLDFSCSAYFSFWSLFPFSPFSFKYCTFRLCSWISFYWFVFLRTLHGCPDQKLFWLYVFFKMSVDLSYAMGIPLHFLAAEETVPAE